MRPLFLRQNSNFSHMLYVLPVFTAVAAFHVMLRFLVTMNRSHLVRLVVVLALLVPVMAFADQNRAKLRLAEAALAAGNYGIVERELLPLTKEKGADPQAVKLLSEAYWRDGQDKKLLALAETHYAGKDKDIWWCRILERRGHAEPASECWFEIGEADRGKRALRAKTFTEELAPGRAFGLRRD